MQPTRFAVTAGGPAVIFRSLCGGLRLGGTHGDLTRNIYKRPSAVTPIRLDTREGRANGPHVKTETDTSKTIVAFNYMSPHAA